MSATYELHFERIGRAHDIDLTVTASSDDDLLDQVLRFVGRHLSSRGFDLSFGMPEAPGDVCKGSIEGGRFGRFTIALPSNAEVLS